ncbi:MAG: DUF2867 domain-containing protein [Chloroflexota bacterium]
MSYLHTVEALRPYLDAPDHFDVKTIESDVSLREFLAGFLSFYPWWIRGLYGVRAVFVRVLGMKQENLPQLPNLSPEEIDFSVGGDGTIFVVKAAQEHAYWVAGATDKHLTANVLIALEPLTDGRNRFHVGTTVYYHAWSGPVYFNVIRPFHHMVVRSMMHAGAAYQRNRGGFQHA